MPDYAFTVGELTNQIKKESKMNIAHLGTDADQNIYIYYYISEALWEFASEIRKKRTTDPLVVTANGYVNFQIGATNITDLYAPLRIFVTSEDGRTLQKRTSFEAPLGWYRESANDPIHIKGAGTYVMQYIAYPTKITDPAQTIDIPSTSFGLLKYKTIALIKESLNDLEGTKQATDLANAKIPTLLKANMDASGYRG